MSWLVVEAEPARLAMRALVICRGRETEGAAFMGEDGGEKEAEAPAGK